MSIEYVDYYNDNSTDTVDEIITEENTPEVVTVVDESAQTTLMGRVDNADRVYVRMSPSRDSKDLTILDKGAELLITGTEDDVNGNGWYAVTTASSIDGYILSDYVTIEE